MSEFNRKNKYSFWHSPFALFVLFCILALFVYNIVGLIEKERETSKKKELILAQIESLRARESSISKDIERLKTEEGVEETIREKYQVVKEGEKMVTIVDEDKNASLVEGNVEKEHNFWGWVKGVFGRK